MEPEPVWVTEAEVVELLDLPTVIGAVESFVQMEADQRAATMDKAQLVWGEGHTLHAIGAVAIGASLVGTKTWAHTANGATPLLLLWDSESGGLRAIIEAFALGQLRTASISSVATKWLARADTEIFAMLGTGAQALPQVAAVMAVREPRLIRVYGPTPQHRETFAHRVREMGFDAAVAVVDSVEMAVRDADVVTTATRARHAFLTGEMLAPGTHINALGAISPDRRELAPDMIARCELVVADSPSAAHRLSIELEGIDAGSIVPLSAIVGQRSPCSDGADLTLFKAMGLGLADLALGHEVLTRAARAGAGRRFDQPQRKTPRLQGGRQ